jgi:hypothetical protein
MSDQTRPRRGLATILATAGSAALTLVVVSMVVLAQRRAASRGRRP